jgi:hypothetical protein
MIYFMYQTTNLLNGKIYIGVHRTKRVDDNYLGSGKLIKRAIKKYGAENFNRVILEFFATKEQMYIRESEVVNKEFVKRSDTYNLCIGGNGGTGFDVFRDSFASVEEYCQHQRSISPLSTTAGKIRMQEAARRVNTPAVVSERIKRWRECNPEQAAKAASSGYQHINTEQSMAKKRDTFRAINHQQGSKNSQYGTVWIFNVALRESRKVPAQDVDAWLSKGWCRGRKMF